MTVSESTLFKQEALTHLDEVRSFAYRLCRDEQYAQDLVQETMLKACTSFHTYRQGTNCRAWLFQICRNTFINELRRRRLQPMTFDFREEGPRDSSDAEYSGGGKQVQSALADDTDMRRHASFMNDEVTTALESLPPEYRTALILCDIEDFTYKEIAGFVSTPLGTIRSRIHRARAAVAGRLTDYAERSGWQGKQKRTRRSGNTEFVRTAKREAA